MERRKATTMGTAGSLVLCGESISGYSGNLESRKETQKEPGLLHIWTRPHLKLDLILNFSDFRAKKLPLSQCEVSFLLAVIQIPWCNKYLSQCLKGLFSQICSIIGYDYKLADFIVSRLYLIFDSSVVVKNILHMIISTIVFFSYGSSSSWGISTTGVPWDVLVSFCFLYNSYFGIILDLHKSCKDIANISSMPFTFLSLTSTSHITTAHLSELGKKHLCSTIKLNYRLCLGFNSFPWMSFFLFQDSISYI